MLIDHQIGFVDEVTYGTPVTVTRFFEFNSESIEGSWGRTEGDPLRTGTHVQRSDRFTPWAMGAAGTVQMDVLTKGFGYFLKHMLGTVATTGPAETTAYTHTGTIGDLWNDAFSCQVGRPLNPSGTVQPFTFAGGKIAEWTLSNTVDGNLVLDLETDFQSVTTATALATASYPTAMDNLAWVGGTVTIGGSQIDVTDISISGNNGLNTDRRFISGTSLKKQPTSGRREITFSMSADFESTTHRDRVAATTKAGTLAQIVATWRGPALLGTTIYPSLTVTIPAARFDEFSASAEGVDPIGQELSGVARFDGTNSPVTIAYVSADTTA